MTLSGLEAIWTIAKSLYLQGIPRLCPKNTPIKKRLLFTLPTFRRRFFFFRLFYGTRIVPFVRSPPYPWSCPLHTFANSDVGFSKMQFSKSCFTSPWEKPTRLSEIKKVEFIPTAPRWGLLPSALTPNSKAIRCSRGGSVRRLCDGFFFAFGGLRLPRCFSLVKARRETPSREGLTFSWACFWAWSCLTFKAEPFTLGLTSPVTRSRICHKSLNACTPSVRSLCEPACTFRHNAHHLHLLIYIYHDVASHDVRTVFTIKSELHSSRQFSDLSFGPLLCSCIFICIMLNT